MVKAKSVVAQNLYFKKDTHWNNVGGYVGFEQLAAALRRQGAKVSAPSVTRLHISKGTLRDMDMEAGAKEWTYEVGYREKLNSSCVVDEKNELISICRTPGTGNPQKLLVWTDSFAAALQPYLNRSFGTVFYSTAGLKKLSEIEKIVDETKPDLVVDELVERYFSRFANYPRILGANMTKLWRRVFHYICCCRRR